jgi:hypothetical protein
MMNDDQVMAATPHAELLAELMNPNTPKNEREHAAVREIERLREALAQPEQEPVAWAYVNSDDECEQIEYCTESPMPEFVPLFTSPPKRKWVGLTDDEIKAIVGPWGSTEIKGYTRTLFDQIEAKLKEKNQ